MNLILDLLLLPLYLFLRFPYAFLALILLGQVLALKNGTNPEIHLLGVILGLLLSTTDTEDLT